MSYRLKQLKKRSDKELLWFYKNAYPQMVNRKNEARRILESRGYTFKEGENKNGNETI